MMIRERGLLFGPPCSLLVSYYTWNGTWRLTTTQPETVAAVENKNRT